MKKNVMIIRIIGKLFKTFKAIEGCTASNRKTPKHHTDIDIGYYKTTVHETDSENICNYADNNNNNAKSNMNWRG